MFNRYNYFCYKAGTLKIIFKAIRRFNASFRLLSLLYFLTTNLLQMGYTWTGWRKYLLRWSKWIPAEQITISFLKYICFVSLLTHVRRYRSNSRVTFWSNGNQLKGANLFYHNFCTWLLRRTAKEEVFLRFKINFAFLLDWAYIH